MKKRLFRTVTLFCCLSIIITGCGYREGTNAGNSLSGSSAVENQEITESTGTESRVLDGKEKNTLIDQDNDNSSLSNVPITDSKSEYRNETVEVNIDNWTDFFSIEIEREYKYDAMKNIHFALEKWCLELKPEYSERLISLTGEVGYEQGYESVAHKVSVVNDDGSYESEIMDYDTFVADYQDQWSHSIDNFLDEDKVSKTAVLSPSLEIAKTYNTSISLVENTISSGPSGVYVNDSTDWIQYLFYPEINIVTIEGEMVLST